MTAGEFRNGVTFEMDGQVQQVIEFQHVKPGKGAAFVRVKMKNVVTGAVTETSFNPTAKFDLTLSIALYNISSISSTSFLVFLLSFIFFLL